MEFTGKLSGLDIDYMSGSQKLKITANEDIREQFDKLRDCEKLSVKIVRYRKKRSLDANAYFHVLVGKIAEAVNSSKPSVKNLLLSKYGQYEIQDDSIVHLIIREDIDVSEMEEIHLAATSAVRTLDDGKLYRVYRVIRGSHTYDSHEMSKLIEGTVSEAKDLGIETVTPDEILAMEEKWRVKFEKRNAE